MWHRHGQVLTDDQFGKKCLKFVFEKKQKFGEIFLKEK
jgi:hypothetical protein